MRSRCVAEVRLLGRRRRHRHADELIAPSTRRSKRARIGERQPELARPTLCAQQYPWSKSELVATRRTLKLWQRQVGVRGGPTNFDFEAIHSGGKEHPGVFQRGQLKENVFGVLAGPFPVFS
jgi:hypothetical protein